MKKHILEFIKRGMAFCWGGPALLAIIYLSLNAVGAAETVATADAAKGILTTLLLAFIAAGITVVYSIEKLPLFPAILIHGAMLYFDYLLIYLANGWLADGIAPFIIFTAIFFGGYAIIWVIIYTITRAGAARINRSLNTD